MIQKYKRLCFLRMLKYFRHTNTLAIWQNILKKHKTHQTDLPKDFRPDISSTIVPSRLF